MTKTGIITDMLKIKMFFVGKRYEELNDEEKKILYTSCLHDDHADMDVIADTVLDAHPNFVDTQLRVAFNYDNETIIS